MAVLNVNIGEDYSDVRKITPAGNINLPDLHRSTQTFIGFRYKALDDPIFKKKNRSCKRYQDDSNGYQ
jgi:hypothetical protein